VFFDDAGRNRLWTGVLLLALLIAMLLWSPWLTGADAQKRAVDGFTDRWQGVMDGCGFNCAGCGAQEAQRILFGYRVRLEYACGVRSADAPGEYQSIWVLISVLGTLHGLPEP